jgi:hypothetical protein
MMGRCSATWDGKIFLCENLCWSFVSSSHPPLRSCVRRSPSFCSLSLKGSTFIFRKTLLSSDTHFPLIHSHCPASRCFPSSKPLSCLLLQPRYQPSPLPMLFAMSIITAVLQPLSQRPPRSPSFHRALLHPGLSAVEAAVVVSPSRAALHRLL